MIFKKNKENDGAFGSEKEKNKITSERGRRTINELRESLIEKLQSHYIFSHYLSEFMRDDVHHKLPIRYMAFISLNHLLPIIPRIERYFRPLKHLSFKNMHGKKLNLALEFIIENFDKLSKTEVQTYFSYLQQNWVEDEYYRYFEEIISFISDYCVSKSASINGLTISELYPYVQFYSNSWSTIKTYFYSNEKGEVLNYFNGYIKDMKNSIIMRDIFRSGDQSEIEENFQVSFMSSPVINYYYSFYFQAAYNGDMFLSLLGDRLEMVKNIARISSLKKPLSNDVDYILNNFILSIILEKFSGQEVVQLYLTEGDFRDKLDDLNFSSARSLVREVSSGDMPLSWALELYHKI